MTARDGSRAARGVARPSGGGELLDLDQRQTRRFPRRRETGTPGMERPAPVVVLVHGGFLGPWIWNDVTAGLEREGIRSFSVDLPSMRGPAGLQDDVRAVRDLLDGLDEVILCGHSYAGMVITEAASGPHRAVRHLVYLTAAVPGTGDSLAGLAAQRAGEEEDVEALADGRIALKRESALQSLFHDCSPERATEAVALLRPGNVAVADQRVTGAAWRSLPFTYVRGADDRTPELVAEGVLDRAQEIVTLPTGHCPQWSRPDLVVELLARVATKVRNR